MGRILQGAGAAATGWRGSRLRYQHYVGGRTQGTSCRRLRPLRSLATVPDGGDAMPWEKDNHICLDLLLGGLLFLFYLIYISL